MSVPEKVRQVVQSNSHARFSERMANSRDSQALAAHLARVVTVRKMDETSPEEARAIHRLAGIQLA